MNKEKPSSIWNVVLIISVIFSCICLSILAVTFHQIQTDKMESAQNVPTADPLSCQIMDTYDALLRESVLQAKDAANQVEKIYWIPQSAEIAPMPNASCYGETTDISSLDWLLEEAAPLLKGQDTLFSTDIEIYPNSTVTYYLDESIFVVTWQQLIDYFVYTFSEVKISHPSQFRRYLANNEYNSDYMHPVSRMGTMANAVMASSADYYRGRNHGIIVYEGEVKRAFYSDLVDTCFIDHAGDLILVPAGELNTVEEAQAFVDENQIDFSLAFGPILVEDGKRCEPENYFLGEVNGEYPRAALCQKDDLHYVVVVANGCEAYWNRPTIHDFAEQIALLNCEKAYTLDGGQTGTIAMNGKALNPVQKFERWISDIIVFATAIPSPEEASQASQP